MTASGLPGEAGSIADLSMDETAHLRFVLRQSFHYAYEGPIAALDQRLVVIPRSRHGSQRRKSHRVSVVGAEGRTSWSRDRFANPVARVHVPVVSESVEFHVEAVIERTGQAAPKIPARALGDSRYLRPTPLTTPDEALNSIARDAVPSGLRLHPRGGAERLCEAVHRTLPYRKGSTIVGTTAAEALGIGSGVCQDHAHVMLAMCHAVGIPARYVSGHLLGEGATHAWVEVIAADGDAAVAVPFDPCHGRTPGASYLTIAVGRDYADVAPTAGTYRGRFANRLTSGALLEVTRLG